MKPYIYTFQFSKNGQTQIITCNFAKRNIIEALEEVAEKFDVPANDIALICFYDATKDEE